MQTKRNNETYQGILELDLKTLNVLHQSDDANRIVAMVQNEDCIELWLLNPLDIHEAIDSLVRYYMTEEPWACFDKIMFLAAAFDVACFNSHKGLMARLASAGKIVENPKTGRYMVKPL